MNNKIKSITAILTITILCSTGLMIIDNLDEAYADNVSLQWDYDNVPSTLNMYGGDSFTLVIFDTDEICAYWGETESTSTGPLTNTIRWATKSFENGNATLKATNIPVGTFLFPITAYADEAGTLHSSMTVVIEPRPLLGIPYTPSSNAIAESNWVYKPTSLQGVTISVSGPSWVHVSDNTVYGIPPGAGDYDITVTMKKAGYADRTESLTLTVVSKLTIANSPLTGAIFFVR